MADTRGCDVGNRGCLDQGRTLFAFSFLRKQAKRGLESRLDFPKPGSDVIACLPLLTRTNTVNSTLGINDANLSASNGHAAGAAIDCKQSSHHFDRHARTKNPQKSSAFAMIISNQRPGVQFKIKRLRV
jgi:hypothetical protein